MQTQEQVPITILTGFLGAGKTTLLNQILHADHGLRVAVLVNDFGAVNIDSQMIVGIEGEDTISLANGCICCTIRDDLFEATLQLFERPQPPEYIIVETSGVSDPAAVAHTFLLAETSRLVRLDSILTIVDAEQILFLTDDHVVLAMDQIGVADIVILNKIDLVTEDELTRVKEWIYYLTPNARVLETTFGQVPPELLLGVGAYDLERLSKRDTRDVHVHEAAGVEHDHDHEQHEHHDHAHDHVHGDHTMVFNTWTYHGDRPFAYKALRQLVNKLPATIYRAKGFLYLNEAPDRKGLLQVVGKRARITIGDPWGEQQPHSQVVVIGTPDGVDAAELQQQFEACLADNHRGPALQSAVEWVRSAWTLAAS